MICEIEMTFRSLQKGTYYLTMNIRFLSWILGVLLTFSNTSLIAQQEHIRLQQFYFEEGLSSRILQDIYQDRRGYLDWLRLWVKSFRWIKLQDVHKGNTSFK